MTAYHEQRLYVLCGLILLIGFNSCLKEPDPEVVVTEVTDVDGHVYPVVQMGEQYWMAMNLRVSHYQDGTAIETGHNASEWAGLHAGAYTVYPHEGGVLDGQTVAGIHADEEMLAAYGALYNWHAVTDPRGLCPKGWRVFTEADWQQLIAFVATQGFEGEEANALKSCRQWDSPIDSCAVETHPYWFSQGVTYGTDDFGFAALPAGMRTHSAYKNYQGLGFFAYFWTNKEKDTAHARAYYLYEGFAEVSRSQHAFNKNCAFSVRCVKDDK